MRDGSDGGLADVIHLKNILTMSMIFITSCLASSVIVVGIKLEVMKSEFRLEKKDTVFFITGCQMG